MKFNLKWNLIYSIIFLLLNIQESVSATSRQPYIDQLKEEDQSEDFADVREEKSFIESIKQEIDSEGSSSQRSYIEDLKESDPLLKSQEKGSLIQEIKEKKRDLEQEKSKKPIHHALGVRYGVGLSRNITATHKKTSFDRIYGKNYAPDLSFFYEFQPFHSEWFGNIGIIGMVGLSYFHGNGEFARSVGIPGSGGNTFSLNSTTTRLQFFSVPVVLGLDYRFNLLRILRPYIITGLSTVGYLESRNDSQPGSRGHSEGYFLSTGVALLLDFLSSKSSWNLYSFFGFQHFYLTLDYSRISTLTGPLRYRVSGLSLGLTFEY